jgi:hypothetical protein
MNYFVGNYTENGVVGLYSECQGCDDFIEAMQEFTDRVNTQLEILRDEIKRSDMSRAVFTSEHCYPDDRAQSIDGKIVAVRADVLRPEYRRGDHQLVLVAGGHGAQANARGNAVFCYRLSDGKHTRFERYDIQGEVKPGCLPEWAKEKAATLQPGKVLEIKGRDRRDER